MRGYGGYGTAESDSQNRLHNVQSLWAIIVVGAFGSATRPTIGLRRHPVIALHLPESTLLKHALRCGTRYRSTSRPSFAGAHVTQRSKRAQALGRASEASRQTSQLTPERWRL